MAVGGTEMCGWSEKKISRQFQYCELESNTLSCQINSPTLQHTLECTTTHCNTPTLQHTLKCTTAHCNTPTLQNTLKCTAAHCNTLQHTAAHCSTLQHTATHCNTLQHTATHSFANSRASKKFNSRSSLL